MGSKSDCSNNTIIYYLTRKQRASQKITKGAIFTDNCTRPGMIQMEDERDYREAYQYDFDTPEIVNGRLGLNDIIVDKVMELIKAGVDNVTISTQMGIPITTVYEIQSGNVYKTKTMRRCLEGANMLPPVVPLNNDQKAMILTLKLEGYNYKEISEITAIDVDLVKYIAKNMNYNNVLQIPGAKDMVKNKKLPPRLLRRLDLDSEDNHQKQFNDHYLTLDEMTKEDIRWIAEKLQEGYLMIDISRMGGYDKESVRSIRRACSKTRGVIDGISIPTVVGKNTRKPMPNYKAKGICEDLQEGGYSAKDLAEKYGVPAQSVWWIQRREKFKDISKDYVW